MDMSLPQAATGSDAMLVAPASRSIGEVLVEAGRLNADQVERITQEQRAHRLRFGEAALKLKLVTLADIEFALARQFEYPYITGSDSPLQRSLVTAYDPFGAVAEQVRSLRVRLMLQHLAQRNLPPTVAVVGAQAREGRSFIAANLAVVFSQMGERTLLIDADLRNPVQHRLFGLDNPLGLSNILLGRADLNSIVHVPQLAALAVLPAGSRAPNPQELLARPALSRLLGEAAELFDVVIIDTPPAMNSADAQIVAARAGSSVFVARRHASRADVVQRATASLREAGANLLGTVLNDG